MAPLQTVQLVREVHVEHPVEQLVQVVPPKANIPSGQLEGQPLL